jgi:N utilization substance protein B
MTNRREARKCIVQFLFQADFNRGEIEQSLSDFWEKRKATPLAKDFCEDIIRGVFANQKKIDALIRSYAENWELKRMHAVDRNVIRMALFEMLYRPDIPPVVSINEAVDIAKIYGSAESGKFVNGILDRALKDINRPSRKAVET